MSKFVELLLRKSDRLENMVNLPMIGGIAFDHLEKNLSRNRGVISIFPTDSIISYLLAAAPASILGVLLFFSSSAFGENSLV